MQSSRSFIHSVRLFSVLAAVVMLAACALFGGSASADPAVTLEQLDGKICVKIDGRIFTEYNFANVPKPYLYPIIGPTGLGMTRNFPMKDDVPGEEHDHPHHRGLWYGHGEINHADVWTERAGTGTIIQTGLLEAKAEGGHAVIKTANKWVNAEGATIMTETRTITAGVDGDARYIDFEIAMHASDGPVHLGDTKEGAMAIRTHPNLRLSPARQGEPTAVYGKAINSEGGEGKPIWGKRAKWVDYYGPIENKVVGIAIFDAPSNPGHPTYWMARDYGLVAADPFGAHAFDPANNAEGAGAMEIPQGETLTFKYRFLFHKGDAAEAKIADRYDVWTAGKM